VERNGTELRTHPAPQLVTGVGLIKLRWTRETEHAGVRRWRKTNHRNNGLPDFLEKTKEQLPLGMGKKEKRKRHKQDELNHEAIQTLTIESNTKQ